MKSPSLVMLDCSTWYGSSSFGVGIGFDGEDDSFVLLVIGVVMVLGGQCANF